MKTLRATFRIVTPAFIGGAEPLDKRAEMRVPSLKGVLRFWWRALNWDRIKSQKGTDEDALHKLYYEEGDIFGTTNNKEKAASQSKVLLKIAANSNFNCDKLSKEDITKPGICYLLGLGLYNENKLTRIPIKAGQDVTLSCCFHRDVNDDQIQRTIHAIIAMGCLGGIGSRARRGWGSLALHELQGKGISIPEYAVPKNEGQLELTIKKITGKLTAPKPPFSAFSQDSRIDILKNNFPGPIEALSYVGEEFQKYRKKFSSDDARHILPAIDGKCPKNHPERVIFGLPHNYFMKKQNADVITDSDSKNRRASPLFIHIHQFPDNKISVVQTLLKADFLAKDTKLKIESSRLPQPCLFPPKIDWRVITAYLDSFSTKRKVLP